MQNQEIRLTTEVVIVGAGPAGLILASLLARWEVPFYLIEKKPTLSKESKAFNLHARSLEIFDQLGIVKEAFSEGAFDYKVKILKKGKIVTELDLSTILPGETPHPHMLILPQDKTEQLLYDSLNGQQERVFWEHELKQLNNTEDEVIATVVGPNGEQKHIHTRYVVGCDGAGSTVRQQAGFTYQGKTYTPTFYLADAEVDWKYPHGNIYFSLDKDHLTAFFPFREKNKYRIFNFMNSAVEKKEDEKLTPKEIQEIVDSNPFHNIKVKNPEWLSVFKIHSRLPDSFRKGRVLLAGDAASVHSPVGGQGMNTALQDSYNLAWKLALVLKYQADPQLLDSYDEERYKIAENLHKTTDRLFSIITNKNKVAGLFRIHIFPYIFKLITAFSPLRKKALRRFSQIAVKYRFSSLNSEQIRGGLMKKAPKPGDRIPYCTFSLNNQQTDTFKLLRCDRFTALIAVSDPDRFRMDSVRQTLLNICPFPIDVHIIEGKHGSTSFFKLFGVKKDALFIIRPDGHLGFRSDDPTGSGPKKYFSHLIGH